MCEVVKVLERELEKVKMYKVCMRNCHSGMNLRSL